MEIDRFVLLIFYSAYSRSENDARIEKSARLIFTPNHPGPYIYARNTRRRGQSPLRINDSRINGHRRAIDAEFRICCAFGMCRIRSINGTSLPRIKIEMERCNGFELSYFLLFSPRRKRGWTRKREGTFPATNPLRKIIILIAALTNDCLSTVDVNTPLLFYFVNA